MSDLEFYRDEAGNPCAKGRDDRLATFIQTDLQGSAEVTRDLIARLKSEENSEFHGNAHSLSIASVMVLIEANFDDEAPDRRLPRAALIEHVEAWLSFITTPVHS